MKWNHKANLDILEQGSPTSGPQTDASCQITSSVRLEVKCVINVMSLNHPKTIPLTPLWKNYLPWNWSKNAGYCCLVAFWKLQEYAHILFNFYFSSLAQRGDKIDWGSYTWKLNEKLGSWTSHVVIFLLQKYLVALFLMFQNLLSMGNTPPEPETVWESRFHFYPVLNPQVPPTARLQVLAQDNARGNTPNFSDIQQTMAF